MGSDNLSFFTQRQHPQWDVVDVKQIATTAIQQVLEAYEQKAPNIELRHPDEMLLTYGDTQWLTMAIGNLLTNSVENAPLNSTSAIEIIKQEKTIEINVLDEGPGVVPGNEYKIFKPFYTTRSGSTGLGLANVRTVMEKHGGGIRVGNQQEGGAIFTLVLQTLSRQQAA